MVDSPIGNLSVGGLLSQNRPTRFYMEIPVNHTGLEDAYRLNESIRYTKISGNTAA